MSNLKHLHHVGYLVKDIEKSTIAFEKLGILPLKDTYFDMDRKVDICFLGGEADCVELVAPRDDSNLYPLLKQYKNMPYHLCYQVEDLRDAIKEYAGKGFLVIKEPRRALAIAENATVAFLMHSKIGIIELLQL